MPISERDVFINCPFDSDYQVFFQAIVFVVIRSGYRPRCALETDDSSQNRLEKISGIIAECRFGIHDISRTELDAVSQLPRFNMPLELGLFLGAKRFGPKAQKGKCCIVLDREQFRFQKYISDIAGQDILSYGGRTELLIEKLASWLRNQARDPRVPGGRKIADEFGIFRKHLPQLCHARGLEVEELTFGDYAVIVEEYLNLTA